MLFDRTDIRFLRLLHLAWCLTAIIGANASAQSEALRYRDSCAQNGVLSAQTARAPVIATHVHRNGRFWNTVNTNGVIGNIYGIPLSDERKTAPTFYYPQYSRVQYGYYSGLWVGGIVGFDTLVSTTIDEAGNLEFWPDYFSVSEFDLKSSDPTSPYYSRWAKAEIECRTVYTDTFEDYNFVPCSTWDGRKHKPLHVAVMQTTYSWSFKYAEDFIIVDYGILNLGLDTIKSAWVGIYYNGCVQHRGELPLPIPDDLAGYIYSEPYDFEEVGNQLMQIAHIVDRDGYAGSMSWDFMRSPHTFGIAPLHVPAGAFTNNFNWWMDQSTAGINWGPRRGSSVRSFFGDLGSPLSDKNKYHLMSKQEIDYSGFEAAIDHTADGWLPPHRFGKQISRGHHVQFVTSFGPFTLPPMKSETLTVVMAIGEDAHTDRNAYRELFDCYNPKPFMDYLDFSDLITNVRWAKLIYDNPGTDTDGDGDSGKWFIHYDATTQETVKVFYEGDGVPDFRGASPPPPPPVRVLTEQGRIVIRWNGYETENHIDPMTLTKDFEGYRVYISRSKREEEAVLLASFDNENYSRYWWNPKRRIYELVEVPFSIDSLRTLYGDSFEPLDYSYFDPLYNSNNAYYFQPVDFNASDFRDPAGIHKRYPDAELDTADVDDNGRVRYYEWEFVIDNLLPTVPHFVSVTAFDFGHPGKSLDPLESSKEASMVEVFAVDQGNQVLADGKLSVLKTASMRPVRSGRVRSTSPTSPTSVGYRSTLWTVT